MVLFCLYRFLYTYNEAKKYTPSRINRYIMFSHIHKHLRLYSTLCNNHKRQRLEYRIINFFHFPFSFFFCYLIDIWDDIEVYLHEKPTHTHTYTQKYLYKTHLINFLQPINITIAYKWITANIKFRQQTMFANR